MEMDAFIGFLVTIVVQLVLAALFVGSFFVLKRIVVFLFLRRPPRTTVTQLRR